MLSPTLPAWLSGDSDVPSTALIPERMLSPTLPPIFNDSPSKFNSPRQPYSPNSANTTSGTEDGNNRKRLPTSSASKHPDPKRSDVAAELLIRKRRDAQAQSEPEVRKRHDMPEPARRRDDSDSEPKKRRDDTEPIRKRRVLPQQQQNSPSTFTVAKRTNSGRKDNFSATSSSETETPALGTRMLPHDRWNRLARMRKHEADGLSKSDPQQAGVIAMDALYAYILSFDYEDRRHQRKGQGVIVNNNWVTLMPYIGWLINLLEEGDCRYLIGMCYQIRALIQLRLVSQYQTELNSLFESEGGNDDAAKIKDIATKLMKAQDSSVHDFKRGVRDLGLDKFERVFPKTWARRERDLISAVVSVTSKAGYDPTSDPYYLPLHTFSSLGEAVAVGYAVTCEWCNSNEIAFKSCLTGNNLRRLK